MLGSLNDSDLIDRIIKSYQNRPSVLKIKTKFGSDLKNFDVPHINAPEVKKLLKEIDINVNRSVYIASCTYRFC